MPTFNFEAGQAAAIADYFALRAAKEWPANYAKKLRFTLGSERAADGVADGALDWPAVMHDFVSKDGDLSLAELSAASGISVADLEGIEAGYQPSIDARFAALKAYGDAQGFRASGVPATSYERIERRSASYLEGRGELPLVGARVGVYGPKCFQCHFKDGEDALDRSDGVLPIAWAPDLAHTRERLREDWTHDWLWWPSPIYPGTSMPANFAGNPPEWQEQFPGSDNADQVQAVLDWLYNYDQISTDTQN